MSFTVLSIVISEHGVRLSKVQLSVLTVICPVKLRHVNFVTKWNERNCLGIYLLDTLQSDRNLVFRTLLLNLRKQQTFRDAIPGFPAKWRLRNDQRNSILMTRHYPDLGSASDWLKQISHAVRPIRSTTQLLVLTRYQYGISTIFLKRQFAGKPAMVSKNVCCFLKLGST